jgi:hypothetical protein
MSPGGLCHGHTSHGFSTEPPASVLGQCFLPKYQRSRYFIKASEASGSNPFLHHRHTHASGPYTQQPHGLQVRAEDT